jgi:hypothetical protein
MFRYVFDGFLREEKFPSPNDQFHPVGVPVDVSVNDTMSGETPDLGVPVKFADGGDVTVI